MNIRTVTFDNFTFVDVHNPQDFEIKFLKHNYGFSQLHLDDYLHRQQIPKIEIEKNYTLFVLDFPHLEKHETKETKTKEQETKKDDKKPGLTEVLATPVPLPSLSFGSKRTDRIRTAHITLFMNGKYLVVLHDERSPQLDEIFEECQKTLRNREEYMGMGPQYLFYRIVDMMVDASLEVTNHITATIDKIDSHLVANKNPTKVIEEISATRRNIVVFQTMIKPALTIFSDLENNKHPSFDPSLSPSWSNITDHLQRIWYRLEDHKELIDGISTSNESLLTFRNNEMVKFLTIVTSISFPFVIVNNLYSMNVKGLPFADQPWIVSSLFIAILVGAVSIVSYFKYKKWL